MSGNDEIMFVKNALVHGLFWLGKDLIHVRDHRLLLGENLTMEGIALELDHISGKQQGLAIYGN